MGVGWALQIQVVEAMEKEERKLCSGDLWISEE